MDPLEQPLDVDPRLQREQHSTGDLTKHPAIDLASQVTIRLPGAGTMVFNRYRLQRVLGRGGMGVVWLAEDTKLNREVALKFLPDVVGADAAAMQELMDETRRGLDLAHPNIVRIYDLVTDDTAAAISMEFVDGRNLSERRLTMPHGIFTVAEAKPWLGHLCSALDYAHLQKRLVHRDLKPANLMLDKQGELKIADFGIARNVSDAVSRLSVSVNSGTSGTLPYMSPQQAMGDQPRPTDDMYSLGATLFELFTGKPPFYSGDITAQVTSKRAPTIRQRREELFLRAADAVPEDWEEAIAACLDKDPAKRPQTAGELARRLGVTQGYATSPSPPAASKSTASKKAASKPAPVAWKEVKTQSTPPGAKKPKSVLAIVLVSVALLVLLVGGAGAGALWWWFHRPEQVVVAEQRAQFDLGVVDRNTDSKAANVEINRNVAAPQEVPSEKPTPAVASNAVPSAVATTEPSGSIPLAQSSLPGGAPPADPLPPPSGSTPSPDRTVAMPSPIQAPPAVASVPSQESVTAGSPQAPAPQVSPSAAPSQPTIPSAEPQATPTTPITSPGAPAPAASTTSSRAALLTGGSVDGPGAGPMPASSTTSVTPSPQPGPPVTDATGAIPAAPGTPGPPATGETVPLPPQPVVQPPAAGYWTLEEILANSEYGSYSEPGRRYLVYRAQQAMKQEADGAPGKGTYKAIQKFQIDSSLQPTGQLDSQTLAALGLSGQPDKADWGKSHRSSGDDDDESTPESEKTAARKFIERKILGGRDLKNIFRR